MKFLPVFILFILSGDILSAQTCTGSLGDPIVNVTFGSGQSFGPPLPANTTSDLGYVAATCPTDGNYSILNYTSGCFANDVTWHTTIDHTGDKNGYFMLVNASYKPSNFYIQTINGLCEGTTYQFAAWMLNMCSVSGTLPNITFSIEKTDGTTLSSYKTGDIPIVNPVTWKQYGFNFTTPPNVSTVVLRMYNNAPGGVGNDLGLDDITFRPIGPAVSITARDFTGNSVSICVDNTHDVIFQSLVESCYVSTVSQWQISTNNGANWIDIPGATGSNYTRVPTVAGTYLYRLTVAEQNNIGISTCRVASNAFTINVYDNDVRTIIISKPNSAICEGRAVTFTAAIAFGGTAPSYQWQLNGHAAGTDSSSYTSSTLATGDVVQCILTSSIPCNAPAISNSITVTVNRKTTSTISRSICEGDNYAGYTTSGTYTDVFTGANGCDSTRILSLTVYPVQSSVSDTAICFGTSFEGYSRAGTYSHIYTSVNGCDSVHTINLQILPDINSIPLTDTILCTGDFITLTPGKFDTYLWQDGSAQSSYTARKGGTYSVQVSNRCGMGIKTIFIDERVCNIMFPSGFTPNDDGINDVFKILNAYHLIYYHCIIFNRWGKKVFESADAQRGWDGTLNGIPAETGTYVWICNYTPAGNIGIGHLKGIVTLLR